MRHIGLNDYAAKNLLVEKRSKQYHTYSNKLVMAVCVHVTLLERFQYQYYMLIYVMYFVCRLMYWWLFQDKMGLANLHTIISHGIVIWHTLDQDGSTTCIFVLKYLFYFSSYNYISTR